jgi:ABC-2 type transport system permease protein
MRILAYLAKTFRENLREWKILVLVLVFAPCFVVLMWGYFQAASPAYRLLVVGEDESTQSLVQRWAETRHPDGTAVFQATEVTDLDGALARLRKRDVDLVVEVPEGFDAALEARKEDPGAPPARLVNHGDPGSVRSSMAMAWSDYLATAWVSDATGVSLPLSLDIRMEGSGEAPSAFDQYIPAMLVLSVIMVMFTAAATLIKEVDKGTISRLILSRLSVGEMLAAVTINQVLIGVTALLLTFFTALAVGWHTEGSLVAVLVVGALSTVGVVAMSVMVAAFLRTIFELLTVGCFPFFAVMFFSDCMMPLPRAALVEVAGHVVFLNDVLPTSLAVRALNRILTTGATLGDVGFELGLQAVVTAVYFAVGTWLFTRRHYRVG